MSTSQPGSASRSASTTRPVRAPRLATPADVPEIVRLIRQLAEYERALHEVRATPEAITHLLFSAGSGPLPGPVAACHVIDADLGGAGQEDRGDADLHSHVANPGDADAAGADPAATHPTGSSRLAGMALWFRNASTWLAVPGIYLEDLYVSPEYRGRGYGRALLATLAALCVEHGYGRLDWAVLDWNSPALGFYESLGAQALSEWTGHRLTGEALQRLAAEVGATTSPPPLSAFRESGDGLPRPPTAPVG